MHTECNPYKIILLKYKRGNNHTPTTEELLLNEHIIYGSSRQGTYAINEFINDTLPTEMNLPANQRFELADHLGTVRAVVTGEKTNGEANILALTDYYPFGMDMPGRVFTGENYRFGFNGKEMDNDISGGNAGAIYDYGFRIYDARIAKFLSVDSLTKSYPWYTPYQFAGNKPIWALDLDGLEEVFWQEIWYNTQGEAQLRNPNADPKRFSGQERYLEEVTGVDLDPNRKYTILKIHDPNMKEPFRYEVYPQFMPEQKRTNSGPIIAISKLYGNAYEANASWEGVEGFKSKGWKLMAATMTSPLMIYSASTGIAVSYGSGITADIIEGIGKSGLDAFAQGLAKGNIDDIDWGDAIISGLPANKYLKSLLKSTINLTNEGLDIQGGTDEILGGATYNIVFEGMKVDTKNQIVDFTVNKVAKDRTKEVTGFTNDKE